MAGPRRYMGIKLPVCFCSLILSCSLLDPFTKKSGPHAFFLEKMILKPRLNLN